MGLKLNIEGGQWSADADAEWTVLLLAGQRPGMDALAAHFGIELKALVPLAGQPMIRHVAESLLAHPLIKRIIVLAQQPSQISSALPDDPRISYHISQSGISSSLLEVIELGAGDFPYLVTTADNPLLDAAMISQFCHDAAADLSIGMVEKRIYDLAYASERRTWLRFKGEAWSGANLFAFRSMAVKAPLEIWADAEKDRKTPWKLFRHFGPWLLIRALTRTIRLADALGLAGRRLGLGAQLVAMADPVAAIDVDKPDDHALAERIVADRSKNHAAAEK